MGWKLQPLQPDGAGTWPLPPARLLPQQGGLQPAALPPALVLTPPWTCSSTPPSTHATGERCRETLWFCQASHSPSCPCRAFRLYLSSKVGKRAVLRATRRFGVLAIVQRELEASAPPLRGPAAPSGAPLQYELSGGLLLPDGLELRARTSLFFSSLVCHVDDCCRLLSMFKDGSDEAGRQGRLQSGRSGQAPPQHTRC